MALNNGVPQELERSPNTSSTGNGKMFVMGRDGLNPSPAGSSPYSPHLDEHGEKSQAPFFINPAAKIIYSKAGSENSYNTDANSGSCDTRISDEEIEQIRLEFRAYSGEGHDLEMLCDQAKLVNSLERDLNVLRRQITTCEHGCPHNRYCEICDED